ncbi:hypothetical protein [Pseudonocardia acaciae]|uniref:hypothetical protein n=1 Tax=Pseudonocardia acaciae TaxID=551276 RepID=UPI0006873625|nr:hypothetical protein [Pseudonocardia acaciae]
MTDIATERRTDPRLWAGIGFVVIFLAGLVAGLATTKGGWPVPTASPDEVLGFFTSNREAIAIIGFTQGLAAVPLVVFSAGLARTLGDRPAPQLIAAGALAAGTLLLSGALTSTLTHPALTGQPALTSALAYLVFLIGGPAHVLALSLLVLTTAVAGRFSGRLPVWLSTFGFVVAALGLVSTLNLAVPALPSIAVAAFIPAGRFLGFVFIVAAVLTLRRSRVSAE